MRSIDPSSAPPDQRKRPSTALVVPPPSGRHSLVTECEHDIAPQPTGKPPPRVKNTPTSPETASAESGELSALKRILQRFLAHRHLRRLVWQLLVPVA